MNSGQASRKSSGREKISGRSARLMSATSMLLGIQRNRPRRRTPWVILAIGILTFATGDTTYNLLTTILREQNPFPSYADLFYLVTCVCQNVGMVLLVRSMTYGRDRSN